MRNITLTISQKYVPGWGLWEALREFTQNALDEHDRGFPMKIERGKGRGGTVRIINQGAQLSRDTLLLGGGNKDGDDTSRGKFGEGYKLAFLVCARAGIPVRMWTGTEIWSPVLAKSDEFDGAETLQIEVRPSKPTDRVVVEVGNVSDDDWAQVQSRILSLKPPKKKEAITVGRDQILLAKRHRGHLFNRGIWVGVMPDNYSYGYDLSDVDLDRDRKMAEPWSLRYEVANLLQRATDRGLVSAKALSSLSLFGGGEARALLDRFSSNYHGSNAMTKKITETFEKKYGEEAVPCTTEGEVEQAAHHGYKGIIVEEVTRAAIEVERGELEIRLRNRGLEPKVVYDLEGLTATERETYAWARKLVAGVVDLSDFGIQVVDFMSDGVLGTHQDSRVRIARGVLQSRTETIQVFVHEVAHAVGVDGSHDHQSRIEEIFAKIVVGGCQ